MKKGNQKKQLKSETKNSHSFWPRNRDQPPKVSIIPCDVTPRIKDPKYSKVHEHLPSNISSDNESVFKSVKPKIYKPKITRKVKGDTWLDTLERTYRKSGTSSDVSGKQPVKYCKQGVPTPVKAKNFKSSTNSSLIPSVNTYDEKPYNDAAFKSTKWSNVNDIYTDLYKYRKMLLKERTESERKNLIDMETNFNGKWVLVC